MSKRDKKKIVNKLNKLFNNYNELSAFCDELSNDINVVIKKINEVIKYAFIKEDFVLNTDSLYTTLLELNSIKDLDKKYKENQNKHTFLSFKRKSIDKNMFSLPLDDDIELNDIEGLTLPLREELEQICKHNLQKAKVELEHKQKKENYYKSQRSFDEVVLEYTRPELVTIDPSFIYYSANLSCDINKDYRSMYSDDRYGSQRQVSSPLNNDFFSNIEKIKKNTDISIRKLGNVHEIKNGRHRIIYILYNGKPVTIPARVSRRIEDKEFNIILINLQKEYHISIRKNNLLNDEPNVLLISNGKLYEIKNKNELITFYNNLRNKISNEHFSSIPFNIINNINSSKIINKYKEVIFKKYLTVGETILTGNFTDAVKHFSGEPNSLFYEAFRIMQYEYQSSIIYGYNFRDTYNNYLNSVITNEAFSDKKSKKNTK